MMNRIISIYTVLLVLISNVSAQEIDLRPLEVRWLDHDTFVAVKCPYGSIPRYVCPNYHHKQEEGQTRKWSDSYDHECTCDSAMAQQMYLARLERLKQIARNPLSGEAEKIIYNFELLTGIRNSGDSDFLGWCYISAISLSGWKVWFNKNKNKLRYCSESRIIFVAAE